MLLFFVCIGLVCWLLISCKADDELAKDCEFTVVQIETLDILFTDHKTQIVFYKHIVLFLFSIQSYIPRFSIHSYIVRNLFCQRWLFKLFVNSLTSIYKVWFFCAELPFGWEKIVDDNNKILYVDHENHRTTYTDPRLAFAQEEKESAFSFRQRFDKTST